MAIKVNTGFLNQSATPLDSRQVVETLDDLLALDENIIYDGMKCYVHQNDCEYKFNSNYNETDTGHWKLNISEGEGVTIDDETISTYKTWSSQKTSDEIAKQSLHCVYDMGLTGDSSLSYFKLNNVLVTPAGQNYFVDLILLLVSRSGDKVYVNIGRSGGATPNEILININRDGNPSSKKIKKIYRNETDLYVSMGNYIDFFKIYLVAGTLNENFEVVHNYETLNTTNLVEIPIAENATMDRVDDGYVKIIKNNDTDTNEAMVISYKNRDLFGVRIYKDDDSEHELKFSASGISYVKNGVTVWGTSVADVPNTVIVSENTKVQLNSNCYYTVINGVCYVTLWGFTVTEEGEHLVSSSMPKTKLTMKGLSTYGPSGNQGGCAYVFYDGNGNNKLYIQAKNTEPQYASFSYPVAE